MRAMMMITLAALLATGCTREADTAEQSTATQSPAPTPPEPPPMTPFHVNGAARDGDDIQVSIRMHGFDTPELNGPHCRDPNAASPEEEDVNVAQKARDALRALIRDRRVDCLFIDYDQQNERIVARCNVDGEEIGEHMVSQGWARDWTYFSEGRYADAEREARQAEPPRGIWAYECPANLWRLDYTRP